ncbi:hypothetical protein AB1Y20_010599 [Prymnesium parvum]|uniref:Nuclear pore complex protein n=1 Tax=Prymnesium parvum TaxID=97485 RepID=A0AB34IT90_PRYPA
MDEQVDRVSEAAVRELHSKGKRAFAEQGHAVLARLVQYAEPSAPRRAMNEMSLNELRACVARYRHLNLGPRHALRFFELAAKCGDGWPTTIAAMRIALERLVNTHPDEGVGEGVDAYEWWAEKLGYRGEALGWVLRALDHAVMDPLTDDEAAQLDSVGFDKILESIWRRAVVDSSELMDATVLERKANDTTMDDELYELVRSRLEAEAGEEAVDSDDTFEEVHRRVRARFWLRCEEFLKTPESERTAWQKACVGLYFTLKNPRCPFMFGGEEAEETFEYLDRQAAAGQGPGSIYKAIKKHGDGAIRLARLRALSLQTIRAESQRRIESQGGHAQSVEMEGDLANAVHCFFRDLGVSGHTHGEPLAWLADGVDLMRLCPASEDGWVKAQRRMEKYSKCSEPSSVTTRTLAYDEDPRARQCRTTIGYTGLPASLCAVLAGRTPYGGAPRLSIVRVPWVSLVVHGAHIESNVCARSIPTLTRVAANYEDVLGELCDHYFGDRGERAMGAVRTLLDAHVHGAVTHEAWARWYAPTSDESAPVLRGVRAESMVVQDAMWQGWATRHDVQMETAGMADTHVGDLEKRRAVWIRWLQRLETSVLERVEAKLHAARQVLFDKRWGCRDVWRAFEDRLVVHEVLERYRPLHPVAFVPGGLLVEDAWCKATRPPSPPPWMPASPRPRKRKRLRVRWGDGGSEEVSVTEDEDDGNCVHACAVDVVEPGRDFERIVIFAREAYLPDIVARVAEEMHGVVLQAMPLDADVLPLWELARARELVQKYLPASQFQGDADFGGGASS